MASGKWFWSGAWMLALWAGACADSTSAREDVGAISGALTPCDSLPEWTVTTYTAGERVEHYWAAAPLVLTF